MESARAGIPLISMGFFADQYRNGRVAERNGWGLPFDKRLLLSGNEEFKKAISKVVGNPRWIFTSNLNLVLGSSLGLTELTIRHCQ